MKTLYIIFLLLFSEFYFAQSIEFNNINSVNVFNIIKNNSDNQININEKSTTQFVQIGDQNKIEFYNESAKSNVQMSQIGDYNTTVFINNNPDVNPEAKINVEGNNNYIDITGNNSISDDIILNFKTNDKMIFMRNY